MQRSRGAAHLLGVLICLLSGICPALAAAQAKPAPRRSAATHVAAGELTVDRIYSEPSLSGHLTASISAISKMSPLRMEKGPRKNCG